MLPRDLYVFISNFDLRTLTAEKILLGVMYARQAGREAWKDDSRARREAARPVGAMPWATHDDFSRHVLTQGVGPGEKRAKVRAQFDGFPAHPFLHAFLAGYDEAVVETLIRLRDGAAEFHDLATKFPAVD